MDLRAKIIAAIEQHCSEGASGRLIGADGAADEILEAISAEAQNEVIRGAAAIKAAAHDQRQRMKAATRGPTAKFKL